jgi:hypothetical protein
MRYTEEQYDEFRDYMHEKFPAMFASPYGGFAVGAGWWPIIKSLCSQIDAYTKWRNNTREALLKDNPHKHKIPAAVPQVVVQQIKEKFGGLRFYYNGGDEHISGMVRMAESWAGYSCEECGVPGERTEGGWIKTLCEKHRKERDARYEEQARKDGLEL